MRRKFGAAFQQKHGVKLGFMSPFVKAAAYALKELPVVNAGQQSRASRKAPPIAALVWCILLVRILVIDEEEIVYRDYVDISVAVATPRGLVVPVLRNVHLMGCADIEKTINELGAKVGRLRSTGAGR